MNYLKVFSKVMFFSLLLSTFAFALPVSKISEQPLTDEYAVKLALLKKIVSQVDWPEGAGFGLGDSPFIFGVYGEVNPFGDGLLKLIEDGELKSRKVKVVFYEDVESIKSKTPDLLYILNGFEDSLEEIASATQTLKFLSIGDAKKTITKGILMAFYLNEEGAVNFSVNKRNFKKLGFKMNPKILRLAR